MVQRSKSTDPEDVIGLKKTLISVAEEILEKQGIEALSLRASARAAGVSHMAPYRHFADKDALLAAVAEKGFHALTAAMDKAANAENTAENRLRAIGVAYVVFAGRHRELYRLMFRTGVRAGSGTPELAEAGETAFSRCSDAVAACYPADDATGEETLSHRSLAIWSLVHGLASLMIDGKIEIPENDPAAAKRMIEAILSSL